MTISQREYLSMERRRSTPTVKMLSALLQHAMTDPSDMAYMEHEALVTAFRSGLDWWFNHEGGAALGKDWDDYITFLKEKKYTGKVFDELFEEYK